MKLIALMLTLVLLSGACTGAGGGRDPSQPLPPRGTGAAPCRDLQELVDRVRRGYRRGPSTDVALIPRAPNFIGSASMPPHTGPWDYLTDVPLVFYGPGFIADAGRLDAPATTADVAPTLARLVGFEEWPGGDGRVLEEALAGTARTPRLVVTVVWDGGGYDALASHPQAWPYLRSLMRRGTSFTRMSLGSSPSNTPPVHATLGTGVFPATHGIVSVRQRDRSGDFIDPWANEDPSKLLAPTLGDLYDEARGNRPLVGMTATVNWHLGMIGHGGAVAGGDRDQALLLNDQGVAYGNEAFYEIPNVAQPDELERFTEELDRSDGAADGRWRGHPLDDRAIRNATPAYTRYQELMLERLIAGGGYGRDSTADLVYVNFKQPDDAGHKWGMSSPEEGEVLAAQDRELRRLVRFLDAEVGARKWVLALTADHGQMPYPEESGAWPIAGKELKSDVDAALAGGSGLIERVTAQGVYVDARTMKRTGLSIDQVAGFLARYTVGDNLKAGARLPAAWAGRAGERLFDAAIAGRGAPVKGCSGS